MTTLRITEIFRSIQGEAGSAGFPTTFVRLTGCPLRCGYCDTAYAFTGGTAMTRDAVLDEVRALGVRHVCVTGGEPLAQRGCAALLEALAAAGFSVSLETSGALPIDAVDARVVRVLDVKTPGSGECHRNLAENFEVLRPHDELKFVICDRGDYDWSRWQLAQRELAERVANVWFSPSYGELEPRTLAQWIVEDRLPVRLQVQLHKLLWGEEPGR